MNQDREIILKMLKDGKVTVEEAEALLQVLEESEQEQSNGSSSSEAGHEQRSGSARPTIHIHRSEEGQKGSKGFSSDADENLDFSFIGETVKKSLSGLKDAIRSAMEGIGDIDFETELKRAFGREKASAKKTLETSAEGIRFLVLESRSGETDDVRVLRSRDDKIRVTGDITSWADSDEEAAIKAESVALVLDREGDTGTLNAVTGDSEGAKRLRIDYEIELPEGINLSVATLSGDIEVTDIGGACTLSTISGDVQAEGCASAVSVRSKSGDLSIDGVGGNLVAATLSGDVTVANISGSVECESKSGDVEIENACAGVIARNVSGDVTASLSRSAAETSPGGPIELQTVSGDVALTLGGSPAFDLACDTVSGELACAIPLDNEKRSRTKLTGRAGVGGTELLVKTVSGDVEIG